MMGMTKKKATYERTKEMSIAIAEASSTKEEPLHQEQQPQIPRKRGRPRKIVIEKTEIEEKMVPASEKKTKVNENEVQEIDQKVVSKQESEQQQPKTTKARRKNKPHKAADYVFL